MGYRTVGSSMQEFLVSAAWTNATTTLSNITGLSFTPEANGVYRFEFFIAWYSNTGTSEGFSIAVDDGNAVSGAADLRVRGASATTAVIYSGPIGAAVANGTSGPASAGDRANASGAGTFIAAASPTAFSIQGAAETALAGATVSIGQYEGSLRVWRLA